MVENKARDAWDRAWSLHMDEFSNKFSNDLIDMEERGSWLCKNWFNAGFIACEVGMRKEVEELKNHWMFDEDYSDLYTHFGSCFYCGQLTGLNKKNLLCEKHDFHGLFRKYRKRIKYLENKLSTTCEEITYEK